MHPSDIQWWRTHSADYVLGLLSNAERLVFERIMPTEPELQEFVVDWREKLQPMSDALPPIQPPDHILPSLISNVTIAANEDSASDDNDATQDNSLNLDHVESTGTEMVVGHTNADKWTDSSAGSHSGSQSDSQGYNPGNQSVDQPTDQPGYESEFQSDDINDSQLNVDASADKLVDGTALMRLLEKKQKGIDAWRSYAGLATAAGLLLAALGWMGLQKTQLDSAEPTFDGISIVQNVDAKALWVVDSSASEKKLRVTAVAPPPLDEGQAFELWMFEPNDGGVVSMGLLPARANESAQFNVHRFSAEAESFGVSIESAEGSPESIPTMPVLYQGRIQTLSN